MFVAPRTLSSPSILSLAIVALALQACGGGGGGSSDDGLADCRAQAAIIGVDFDYYQAVGACGEGVENGFDNGFSQTPLLSLPEDTTASSDAITSAETAATAPPLDVPARQPGPALADVPGSSFYVRSNNAALLRGPVIGDGTALDSGLVRSIPFRVETSPEELELLHVSVAPWLSGTPKQGKLFGIVENRSDRLHCYVSLEGIDVRDAAGAPVGGERAVDVARVEGIVGTSDIISNQACIAPKSRAHVSFPALAAHDEVGSLVVSSLESRTGPYRIVENPIEPVSYELDGDRLNVRVANRGIDSVDLGFGFAYLLDDNGHVLWSEVLRYGADTLIPGEEGVVSTDVVRFTGQSTTVRVVMDFAVSDESF